MKYYVYVGLNAKPYEADDPAKAINLAERRLTANRNGKEGQLPIMWRRDDLFPNIFIEYTPDQLVAHLNQESEVVLQLAKLDTSGLPIYGEIANILSESKEMHNQQEADQDFKELLESMPKHMRADVRATVLASGIRHLIDPTP